MQYLATISTSGRKRLAFPSAAKLMSIALLFVACTAPIAIQHHLLIGAIGVSAIIAFGFLGSITVIPPVPVLSLVFAGATILTPITLVIFEAASITAGMAVCYMLGKRGHS